MPRFELDVVERFAIDAAIAAWPGVCVHGTVSGGSAFPVQHSVVTAEFGTVLLDPRSREPYAALELLDHNHVYLYLPGVILDLVLKSGWSIEDQRPTGVPWVAVAPYVHGASVHAAVRGFSCDSPVDVFHGCCGARIVAVGDFR